jgi:hypothetical protein
VAAIESPEKVGLKPIYEFDEANETGMAYGRVERPASGNGRPG